MKKTISFEKKIEFPTMIGEVSAISLDQDLKFIDESNITGNLIVSGRYKMTEASRLEEDFNYELPVEIILTEKLDLTTTKVDVDDFYYEIENDDTMICYIDIKVEGVEIIDTKEKEEPKEDVPILTEISKVEEKNTAPENDRFKEVDIESSNTKEEVRECDGEYNLEMENEEMSKEAQETSQVEKDATTSEEVGSLFSSFKDSDETFATYSVYILRQEETIQTVIDKYHTSKEELEKYNDLNNLTIGAKIIIPTTNE